MGLETAFFFGFAGLALAGAVGLLVARHPVYGAASLLGTMLSLAGIYYLLSAPVAAMLQVLVYAGAIMMLIVFVIMVLNAGSLPWRGVALLPMLALALPALLLLVMRQLTAGLPAAPVAKAADGGMEPLARLLYGSGPYALAFELTGVTLLAALVAAVLLAKKRLDLRKEGGAA